MAENKLRGQKSGTELLTVSQKQFKFRNKAKSVITNLKKIPQQHQENEPVNADEATRLMAQL
ncbi:uncharacterized protein C8orf59 homolog [Trichechus manatus latirostris]|uniref:Uncharacterized protein C8orf59 homolog n=1 Tax=Trichechus manatus latirostris TaxID=127582 RepID=A0A2Y9FXP1_TRIMA|nr:uncharacterized protein C8orf59 homolog [Trichechus manatus latirostris]